MPLPIKPLFFSQRRGWVLLVLLPFCPAPPQDVPVSISSRRPLPAAAQLRAVLAQPGRVYALADSVEVVLQNMGPEAVQVVASTALVIDSGPTPKRVLLALDVSQTQAAARVMATPPCLRLAPASRTRMRWPVHQLLGYSGYTPSRLVKMARGPILRIAFTFKQCGRNTQYTPSWTLQVRP